MKDHQIYPKEFNDNKTNIKYNFCFVIIPFNNEESYKKIQEAAESRNYVCHRSDGFVRSSPFLHAIIDSIKRAFFLIVDISNQNPNVFYELGIAHAIRSSNKILILKDKKTKCPSDIIHMNYYEYDENNFDSIVPLVKNFIDNNKIICDLEDLLMYTNLATEKTVQNYATNLEKEIPSQLMNIIYILNNSLDKIDIHDVDSILFSLWNLILEEKYVQEESLNSFFMNLFFFIIQKTVKDFNLTHIIDICLNISLDLKKELKEVQADIASILIITKPNTFVFSWISNYLMNCSPAGVDIIKFKLQVAIINSKLLEIEQYLLDNLSLNINHMDIKEYRSLIEHSLNLCKEKGIKRSISIAINYIEITLDPYIFRSAMDLIFQLAEKKEYNRYLKLIETRKNFIKKHQFLKSRLKEIQQNL